MRSRNPHERRGAGLDTGASLFATGGIFSAAASLSGEGPMRQTGLDQQFAHVEFEDVAAMVRSAYMRGRRDARREFGERHQEELQREKFRAWEDGARVGHADVLIAIDEQFGEKVRETVSTLGQLALQIDHGEDKVPRSALYAQLRWLGQLLTELVNAHHCGFAGDGASQG